jgi:hypothetical protein
MFDSIGLTKEIILDKVSQYQIFKYYCKNFQEGRIFCSELREDSTPSCKIYNNGGNLLYFDYGTREKHDCFSYVQAKHKKLYGIDLNFGEVLKVIAADFGFIRKIREFNITPSLNYIGKADTFKGIKTKYILKKKRRSWNKADTYWRDYYLSQELLDFYNVQPLEYYWKSNSDGGLTLVYDYNKDIFQPAYSYEEINGYRKILRPYETKLRKWDSCMPKQIVEGYTQLENTGEYCIITSSRKDTMAWRLFGYNACNPGSESTFLTENCFLLLKSRFKYIVINYDNDEQGLKSMKKYSEQFNIPAFIIPKYSNAVTDLSDVLYFKGYDTAQNLIKNFKNNLIYGPEF